MFSGCDRGGGVVDGALSETNAGVAAAVVLAMVLRLLAMPWRRGWR